MVTLKRSKLPTEAKRVEADLWVSNGRAYREVDGHYVCEGLHKKPPSRRANRKGKLSEEDASFIKSQLDAGASQKWLSKKFDVSAVTIHNIGKGKIWESIESPIMELEGPPKGVHNAFWSQYLSEEDYLALNLDGE